MNNYVLLSGFMFFISVSGSNAADPQLLIDCEMEIKEQLISPSSYKRIKVTSNPIIQGLDIEYDAVNAYNVPIRHIYTCNPQMIELNKQFEKGFEKAINDGLTNKAPKPKVYSELNPPSETEKDSVKGQIMVMWNHFKYSENIKTNINIVLNIGEKGEIIDYKILTPTLNASNENFLKSLDNAIKRAQPYNVEMYGEIKIEIKFEELHE